MGRRKRAVKSNLVVILMHLWKHKYQPEKFSLSWKFNGNIGVDYENLADSPSLKPYFRDVFEQCYSDARLQAADETGLPLRLSRLSPPTPEEALNPD